MATNPSGLPASILSFSIGLLVALAVTSAMVRAVDTIQAAPTRGQVPALSAADQWRVVVLSELFGIRRGTRRHDELRTDLAAMTARFTARRIVTLIHVGSGTIFLLLAPLQFISRIRARHIQVHRWSGRLLLALALPLGASGIFFGAMPFAGPSESIPTFLFGSFFLYAAMRALTAIRRRDTIHHREWVIRMFAAALAISTVRVVQLMLFATTEARPRDMLVPSFWLGWIITLFIAELWIRHTRGWQQYTPGAPASDRVAATRATLFARSRDEAKN